MSVIRIRDGKGYVISGHMEYQLLTEGDFADLPGKNTCAVGSIAYQSDYSKIWNLGEDNTWRLVSTGNPEGGGDVADEIYPVEGCRFFPKIENGGIEQDGTLNENNISTRSRTTDMFEARKLMKIEVLPNRGTNTYVCLYNDKKEFTKRIALGVEGTQVDFSNAAYVRLMYYDTQGATQAKFDEAFDIRFWSVVDLQNYKIEMLEQLVASLIPETQNENE